MLAKYSRIAPKEELPDVVVQCEEPVNRPTATDCPLCDDWEKNFAKSQYGDLSKLRKHLGRHMEQLALFALPRAEPDEDKSDEDGEVDDDISRDSEGEKEEIGLTDSIRQQGKYAEAEAMYRQTLQLQEKVLGKYHLDILMSIEDIALLLRQQGKHAEAEAMYRQMLQLQEKVLGKDHPETLRSMKGLALLLRRQGKHAEAEATDQ